MLYKASITDTVRQWSTMSQPTLTSVLAPSASKSPSSTSTSPSFTSTGCVLTAWNRHSRGSQVAFNKPSSKYELLIRHIPQCNWIMPFCDWVEL